MNPVASTSRRATTGVKRNFQGKVPSHCKLITNSEGLELFECKTCGKSFKTKAHCRYHEYCDVNKKKPISCSKDECAQKFITKHHYLYHLAKAHGHQEYLKIKPNSSPIEKPKCDLCNTEFASERNLNSHNKTVHCDNRPFECNFLGCGKLFKTKSILKRHSLIHSREEKAACEQFPGKYNNIRLQLLYAKQSQLNGVESFSCNKPGCGKVFLRHNDLLRHWLSHTEEKPYRCSACGMKFNRKGNLQRHFQDQHGLTKEEASLEVNAAAREFLNELRSERDIPDVPDLKLHSTIMYEVLELDTEFRAWPNPLIENRNAVH